jgi:protein TonB
VTADDYPAVSIRLQEQGTVQVRYFVNTSGDVGDCQVTSSSGMARLDDAACRMVKARWKFRPAVVNDGTPIPVWLDGQITFQLQ